MNTRSIGVLAMVASACLLAGPTIGDALAKKKPKPPLTARVNGKALKANGLASALSAGTSFSVNGQTKPKHGLSRAVTANCLGNLATLKLPATISCYGTYTEARKRGTKSWQRNEGIDVTIESYDGTHVSGSFRGMLDPGVDHASDPTVSIEQGAFVLYVTQVGV